MRNFFVQTYIVFSALAISGLSASAQIPSALDFIKPHEYGKMAISPDGRYAAIPKVTTQKYCLDRFDSNIAKSQICNENRKVYRAKNTILVFDLVNNQIDQEIPIPEHGHISGMGFVKNRRLSFCQSYVRTSGTYRYGIYTGAVGDCISLSVGKEKELRPPSKTGYPSHGLSYGIPALISEINDETDDVIFQPSRFRIPYGNKMLSVEIHKKVNVYEDSSKTKPETFETNARTVHLLTDKNGTERVHVVCNRDNSCESMKVLYRADGQSDWETVKEFNQNEELEYFDILFFPFSIDRETGQIFTLSRERGEPRKTVKLFDPGSQQFTRTVAEHPELDVERLLFDPLTHEFNGAVFEGGRTEYLITDPGLKVHYDFLAQKFPADNNFSIVGNNVQGERALIYVTAHNLPGKYYMYNPATKDIKLAIDRNASLAGAMNSGGNIMKVKMRDGHVIDAYHHFPKGKPKGAPLIVMPHGGPHVRDYFDYNRWVQFFVSRGYQVVQMNFRGSTGYGVEHETAGFGEWGGVMQDDVTDTVKYFHNNGYAAPDSTCIAGYSYGGYAALYGGATTPELYACIVSGGGVTDLVRSMKDDRVRFSSELYSYIQESMGDLRDKDSLREKSPTKMADSFQAPVLLIHGERDLRVPNLHSRRMKDALEDADKTVTYLELEDAGHGDWTLENEVMYLETVEEFLRQHIGP